MNSITASSRRCVTLCLFVLVTQIAPAQTVRPIRDEVGFCWRAAEMNKLMSYLSAHPLKTSRTSGTVIGGISPHDDYLYAARVYAPLYRKVSAPEVIIIGLTHGDVRKEIGEVQDILMFDDFDKWAGPYGNVAISPLREYVKTRLDTTMWRTNDRAQVLEHSIEALVPFLQYYRRDVKIFPLMVTAMPFDRMKVVAEALASVVAHYIAERHLVLGKDIDVLVSTDANHYGADFGNTPFGDDSAAHAKGTALDRDIIKTALSGTVDEQHVRQFAGYTWGGKLTDFGQSLWCGRFSVVFGSLFTQKLVALATGKSVTAVPLAYSDTETEGVIPLKGTHMGTTAPFSLKHWCGWCSIAFELK